MFNIKDLTDAIKEVTSPVKEVADAYKAQQEGKTFTKKEKPLKKKSTKKAGTGPVKQDKGAERLAALQRIFSRKKAPEIRRTTSKDIAQRRTPEQVKEMEEKKKYATPDFLARFTTGMTGTERFADPVQQLFRSTQDKFKTPRGYKRSEAIEGLADKRKMSMLDRAHGKATEAWRAAGKSERQSVIDKILGEKREREEDVQRRREKHALTPEQAFRERQLSPIGADPQSRVMGEGIRQGVGGALSGFARGRSLGISDVVMEKLGIDRELQAMYSDPLIKGKGGEFYEQERLTPDHEVVGEFAKAYAGVVPKVASVVSTFAGGAKTFGAVAGQVEKGLSKIQGPLGNALAKRPVMTAYLVRNPLEEVVEIAVRKGTGQEYTWKDFAWGIAAGTAFTSLGIKGVREQQASRNIDASLKQAEELKGRTLTPAEFKETVLNTRVLGDRTARDLMADSGNLFRERKLAYKTGGKKDIPGMTRASDIPEVDTRSAARKVLKEDVARSEKAGKGEKLGLIQRAKNFVYKVDTGFFDKASFVEYMLRSKVKRGELKESEAVEFAEAYDRSLRSSRLANQFIEDIGFKEAATEAASKDISYVGSFLKKQHQLDLAKHHKFTDSEYKDTFGSTKQEDRLVVHEYGKKYAKDSKRFQEANKALNDYLVESGLISAKDMKALQELYPKYVPLHKYDIEGFKETGDFSKQGFNEASLSKQRIIQEFKGGQGVAKNPYEGFIEKVNMAFRQGEKNKVATTFARYAEMDAFKDTFKNLKKKEHAQYEIDYLKNGEKYRIAVPKEVHDFAKGVGVEKSNAVFDASRFLMRGFKAGTTGLNPSFLLRNVARDIQTAKMLSKYGLNLRDVAMAIGSKLKSQVSKTKIGEKLGIKEGYWEGQYRKRGGKGTSEIDVTRKNKMEQISDFVPIKDLPKGEGVKGKLKKNVKYVTRPLKKVRKTLEENLSISEDATRIGVLRRNFKGFKKKGYDDEEALRLAFQESLDATANFIRGGRFKNVITGLYPYQAAGFAGARSFRKAMARNPGLTTFRIAKNLIVPEATLMAWNLMNPERREIYEDIPDFEKDMNYIAISPWAKWDEDANKWVGVYKFPKPPGIMAISAPVRKMAESHLEVEGGEAGMEDWVNAIASPVFGFEVQENVEDTAANLLTPHIPKIGVEQYVNKKFFTGKEIVAGGMADEDHWGYESDPAKRAYPWTPETYKLLGEKLGISPLRIEHFVRGMGGSGTEQVIGAKSMVDEIFKGFHGTYGGAKEERKKEKEKAKEAEEEKRRQSIRDIHF